MAICFRSKVDTWLWGVILFTVGISAYAGGLCVLEGEWLAALLIGLFGPVVPLWLLFSTRYIVADNRLRVRAGPFSWVIPLDEITSVQPSRNPLSSPALSLDRLVIRYGRGHSLMVSPREKDAFLRAIGQA